MQNTHAHIEKSILGLQEKHEADEVDVDANDDDSSDRDTGEPATDLAEREDNEGDTNKKDPNENVVNKPEAHGKERKTDEGEPKKKHARTEKRIKKTRLETALGTVMKEYSDSNSKFETAMMSLEEKKLDAEI